jgi:hypothetical protein
LSGGSSPLARTGSGGDPKAENRCVATFRPVIGNCGRDLLAMSFSGFDPPEKNRNAQVLKAVLEKAGLKVTYNSDLRLLRLQDEQIALVVGRRPQ